jgi:hypothetical protein
VAAGGVAAAVVLAFLASSIGNHSFYPREGSVPMWCAIGLMLRVWVERARVDTASRARLVLARRAGERPAPAAEAMDEKLWAA